MRVRALRKGGAAKVLPVARPIPRREEGGFEAPRWEPEG